MSCNPCNKQSSLYSTSGSVPSILTVRSTGKLFGAFRLLRGASSTALSTEPRLEPQPLAAFRPAADGLGCEGHETPTEHLAGPSSTCTSYRLSQALGDVAFPLAMS